MKSRAALPLAHAALALVGGGPHGQATAHRLKGVRHTRVAQGAHHVALVQLVAAHALVGSLVVVDAGHRVLVVDGTGRTFTVALEMPLDGGQVIFLGPAIGVETGNDTLALADLFVTVARLVHPDLARQARPAVLARQVVVVEHVKFAARPKLRFCPLQHL